MKKLFVVPAVAGLLTLGGVTVAEASAPTTPAPAQTDASSDDDGGSKAGLFGLFGLLGLAGLAGLKRRDDDRYNDRSNAAASATR